MPLFKQLTDLEIEASEFGFRWYNAEQILTQIRNECDEFNAHLIDNDTVKLQEEIGDLLHAAFSLCVFCGFDASETVEKSVNKFERRFGCVKKIAKEHGLTTLNGKPFEELMTFWDEAKQRVE